MERTLVMLKPDAVQRGFIGQILARFEAKGFKIVAMKMAVVARDLAERHYAAHKGKDFYEPLIRFVTSGPTVFLVLEGKEAVAVVRKMVGVTFGVDAEPGTVRANTETGTEPTAATMDGNVPNVRRPCNRLSRTRYGTTGNEP